MKKLAVGLFLLAAACAPQPSDFQEACRQEELAKGVPASIRHLLNEQQSARYLEGNIQSCASTRATLAQWDRQRAWAPYVAGTLAAASDAIAQHDFYVYRVPEARRYLARTRR